MCTDSSIDSIFTADGDTEEDVKRRIVMVMNRMGELRHVFSSNSNIKLALKMKVYQTAV